MRIENAAKDFLRFYNTGKPFVLNEYHLAHPEIFNTYFNGYCKKTSEKITASIDRYSKDYSRLEKVATLLPDVIERVATKGKDYFGFSIGVPVHIFVGLYASNAFVDHQAELYLAVEKLPPDPGLLEIIVAHEMVHSYHYHLLSYAGIDWQAIDWSDARISMYLDGVATYLSKKLIPGYSESVYFSYDENGEDCFSFCKERFLKLLETFRTDLEKGSMDMEREWFRLSGGKRFGYSRIGYYLGTAFVHDLCMRLTESETLMLLAKGSVPAAVDNWFESQCNIKT